MNDRLEPRTVRYGGAMFGKEEIDQVNGVLTDPMGLIPGIKVSEFEGRVAAFMGKKHGVMVNSGSSALMLAMRLLDLPKGSEIITPALTFSTDISSIYFAGYKPVFVDVGLNDYQILVGSVEELITSNTKAILVPDLVGGICDWDVLRNIANKHNLKLVHDSADTLGGSLRGKKTATRADISITSFSIYHIITALGNGGMVFFDDDSLLDKALSLRSWGRSSEKYMFGTKVNESDGRFLEKLDGLDYDSLFIFEDLAYGFIPNEAGAAFGIAQMDRIEELWELRNSRFDSYYKFFENYQSQLIIVDDNSNDGSSIIAKEELKNFSNSKFYKVDLKDLKKVEKISNAEMFNVLGKDIETYRSKTFSKNEFFYDYGKKSIKDKRKMGHLTVLKK